MLSQIIFEVFFVDSNGPPEHQFFIRKHVIKKGPKAGEKNDKALLVIPPYSFRRQRDGIHEDDKAYFVCKFCDSYAHATLNFDDDGNKKYILEHWPTNHECKPDLHICYKKM